MKEEIVPIRTIIDQWAEEQGQELQTMFRGKVTLQGCYQRVLKVIECFESASDSFTDILETQVFPNYHMLDLRIGRDKQVLEYGR